MITGWDIYWITRLDSIQCFFGIIGGVILAILVFIGIMITIEEEWEKSWKPFFSVTLLSMIMIFISVMTPSTKEAVAIWAVPKIVNNEQVQQIPENFGKLVNKKLQEWMHDTEILSKEEK